MKNFSLILAILCLFVFCGCGKKSAKENLAKCSDRQVLELLKVEIKKAFDPLCNTETYGDEYCNAENGEFDRTLIEFDAELGECSVPFIITNDTNDDGFGWIIGYTVKYENGKFDVKMLDCLAY